MANFEFDKFMVNLSEVIKNLRKEKKLTQGELSEKIGKPQSTIARLETLIVKDTHISLLFEICSALEIDLSTVMAEATNRTELSTRLDTKDLDLLWGDIRGKVDLWDKNRKMALIQIIDNLFRLAGEK